MLFQVASHVALTRFGCRLINLSRYDCDIALRTILIFNDTPSCLFNALIAAIIANHAKLSISLVTTQSYFHAYRVASNAVMRLPYVGARTVAIT
jgi:hypothetical protein